VVGDQLSLVDLYLAAWITHLFNLAGAPMPATQKTPNGHEPPYPGYTSLENCIRVHIGDQSFILGRKLRRFWEAIKERDSWGKVYGDGLR
jgi:hypothetical protein